MLGTLLDVFRLRQYFNVITRSREWVEGLRDDAGFLADAGRVVVRLPTAAAARHVRSPFPPMAPYTTKVRSGQRVAVATTGGSGAMASVVGAGRALEEAGLRPAVISLCSGAAMFGFPLAAGIPAEDVAAFTLGLRAEDYIDVD